MVKSHLVFLIAAAAFSTNASAQTQASEQDLKTWIRNAEFRITRDEKSLATSCAGNKQTTACKNLRKSVADDKAKLARHQAALARLTPAVARDLTPSEVAEAFKGFDLVREGNNYRAYGVGFKACDAKFKLVKSDAPGTGSNGKSYSGLRVVDLGGGLSCVASEKKKIEDCGGNLNKTAGCFFGADHFVQLSDPARDGNLISLADNAITNIGIETIDPSQPANAARFHDVPGRGEIVHVGSKIIEEREHVTYVDNLNKQFRDCRKDVDQLKVALAAYDILKDLNEFKGNLDEDLKKAHLDLLAAYAKKIGNLKSDELDALREELSELSGQELVGLTGNDFAKVFLKIAQQYQKDKEIGLDAYTKSIETLRQAQEFDGVSDVNKLRMENHITEVQMNELLAVATDGVSDRSVYREKRDAVMERLQELKKTSCNSKTGSIEGCSSAKQAISTVRQRIPQQAQIMNYNRRLEEYQRRMEEYQEIYGGGINQGYDFGMQMGGGFGGQGLLMGSDPSMAAVGGIAGPQALQFNSAWRPTQAAGTPGFYNPATQPQAVWAGGNYGINSTGQVPLTQQGGPVFQGI